ncbi:MAG: hypothetical protein QG552_662, partial [Thermodesulfobacteriota bacterium]|nr:hypothetical protein [Thermodesulfobacteriota bacterium]
MLTYAGTTAEVFCSGKLIPSVMAQGGSGTRGISEGRLAERGVNFKKAMAFGPYGSGKEGRGIRPGGVGILSKLAIAREGRPGLIKSPRLEGVALPRTFFFAYRKDKYLTTGAETFLQDAVYG